MSALITLEQISTTGLTRGHDNLIEEMILLLFANGNSGCAFIYFEHNRINNGEISCRLLKTGAQQVDCRVLPEASFWPTNSSDNKQRQDADFFVFTLTQLAFLCCVPLVWYTCCRPFQEHWRSDENWFSVPLSLYLLIDLPTQQLSVAGISSITTICSA